MVFLTVPDDAITALAKELAAAGEVRSAL